MALEFQFPDVGEGIHDGEIVKWQVKEGDSVKADQPLVDVETDKAIVTIPSPRSGVVLKIIVFSGTIKVGSILCVIGDKGEKYIPSQTKVDGKKSSMTVMGELEIANDDVVPNKAKSAAKKSDNQKSAVQNLASVKATFATRQLAKQLTVDIFNVKGTGHDGRITDDDVKAAATLATGHLHLPPMHPLHPDAERIHVPKITAPLPHNLNLKIEKKYDIYGKIEMHPLTGIRKTIADNMVKSFFAAPHVTHMDEADVTELAALVEKEKKNAEKKKIHLTYLPFIAMALLEALKKHPVFN